MDELGKKGRPAGTSPQSGDDQGDQVRRTSFSGALGRKTKGLFSFLFLLIVLLLQGPVSAENGREAQGEPDHVETYRYQAVPMGREADTEQIRMDLSFRDDTIGYASTSVSEKEKEKGKEPLGLPS